MLFLPISVLYGAGTLFALELMSHQMDAELMEIAFYGIQIFIWIFILLKDVLPAPTPLQEYFQLHLPRSPVQITILYLCFDLFSVSSIALFSFSAILFFSPHAAYHQVLSLFLIIVLGTAAIRLLRTILAYSFQSNTINILLFTAILITALLSGVPGYGMSDYQPWVFLLLIMVSIARLSQLERQKPEVAFREKNLPTNWSLVSPPASTLIWRTFRRTKLVRNAVTMSLVNKLGILAIYLLFSSLLFSDMSYTLFLLGFSPFFLLGTVFSNLTGYLPGLSRRLVLTGNGPGPLIKLFFTGSLLFLMADFILAILFALLIVDLPLPTLLLFYLGTTLWLLITGLLGTLFFPKPVVTLDWGKFTFNTHPMILFSQALCISILAILIEYIPSASFLSYLTLGLILALVVLLYWLPNATRLFEQRLIGNI